VLDVAAEGLTPGPTTKDPFAFVTALAAVLAPLGVKRCKVGNIELEFHDRQPEPPPVEPSKPSQDDERAALMEGEPTADPIDDASTFNGRPPPTYGRAPRKPKKPWSELDTEGQD
jgi:hypothetical protein